MSEPRGGDQARSFREVLTSRVIPEATEDGADTPTSPSVPVPEPPPEGESPRPPVWAAPNTDPAVLENLAVAAAAVDNEFAGPVAVEIPNNIMLHGYRTLEPAELDALREVKDLALTLWNTLKQIDQSSAEEGYFHARPLQNAGTRLEECVLWVEKHFLG